MTADNSRRSTRGRIGRSIIGAAGVLGPLSTAAAQINSNARLEIIPEGRAIVSPSNPVVTLGVWAGWDPAYGGPPHEWFLIVRFDFRSAEPGLENPVVVLSPGASTWGTPQPLGLTGAAFGQVHIPSIGLNGNLSNPLLLGTVQWQASSFESRVVQLWTENEDQFFIGNNGGAGSVELSPITSGQAVITVLPCYADCDSSTTLDIFDFLCFQNAFIQGEPYADCDGNGAFDIFDFVCFQDEFVQGCP